MDETRLAWRVGIVVICAALILGILIFLFGEGWQSQYTVFVNTRTAPNVTSGTPVRKNGILIGRVDVVENQDRGVMLTLKINANEPLYENELCKIGTASFLGDAVVDFVPGNLPGRGNQLTDRVLLSNVDGQPTRIAVERNPLELIDVALNLEKQVADTLVSVKNAGDTITTTGQEISDLTNTFQEALGDDTNDLREFLANAKQLSERADQSLESFNSLMTNINELVGDEEVRENLSLTINRLPEVLEQVNTTVTEARDTINGFRDVSELADQNLANLTDFTAALGDGGPELVANLNSSLAKIDSLISDIGNFTASLATEGAGGSLGKLINDPELYDNLNETIRNARDISVQLKPLINDLRYAADGIARDPGQLGLRGALEGGPAFGIFKGTITGR